MIEGEARRRLSVVHVTEPVDGGVAQVVLALARGQVARGWDVAVVAPSHAPFSAALREAGARHVAWAIPPSLASARDNRLPWAALGRQMQRLRTRIAAYEPDVVHVHSSVAGLAARVVVRSSVPTVFQPHAWSFLAAKGLLRRAALSWERFAARWTATVVCVSEAERRLGEAAGIRAPMHVVANGVDLELHAYATEDVWRAARTRLGLGTAPLVVCVGGLRRQKGQDVLLDAWTLVRARVPAAEVVFVGDGPARASLTGRHVAGATFVGEREDAADWLAAADVVALPSRWEGLSIVLLEAMARGRSVVATDVPGAREALADAGAIVPVSDVGRLANAVAHRLLDPALARREGEAVRHRAEQLYGVRRMQDGVAAVYDAVLAERR